MAKVLKPFPYAGDGITVEWLTVGLERDFGSATVGLEAEGFIEVSGNAAIAEPALANTAVDEFTPPATAEIDSPKRGRRR